MTETFTIDVKVTIARKLEKLGQSTGLAKTAVISQGTIGLVARNQQVVDAQSFSEVYLPGEVVRLPMFKKDATADVLSLVHQIGTIGVEIRHDFPGFSVSSSDTGIVKFLFPISIKDPIVFVNRFNGRAEIFEASGGLAEIDKEIGGSFKPDGTLLSEGVLRMVVKQIFHNVDVDVWTTPDILRVNTQIRERINHELGPYGLWVDSHAPAYRIFPNRLYEIVFQFRAAELELLRSASDGAVMSSYMTDLGLSAGDLPDISNRSEATGGQGAGFFLKAIENPGETPKFIAWLEKPERKLFYASSLLNEVFQPKNPPVAASEIAMVREIMLVAFRNPLMGVGEWEQHTMDLPGLKAVPSVEDFMRKLRG